MTGNEIYKGIKSWEDQVIRWYNQGARLGLWCVGLQEIMGKSGLCKGGIYGHDVYGPAGGMVYIDPDPVGLILLGSQREFSSCQSPSLNF